MLNVNDYIKETDRQLSDEKNYKRLPNDAIVTWVLVDNAI